MSRQEWLDRLYDWIVLNLSRGETPPSNGEICDRFGLSDGDVRGMLASLADARRIVLTGFGVDRVITLPAAPRRAAPVVDKVLEAGTARILAALSIGRAAPIAVPANPASIPESTTGEPDVPNPPPSDDFRNVSILARGDVLRTIQTRAVERDLSLNKAAISLIEDALAQPVEVRPMALNDLPGADLLGELSRRLDHGSLVVERDAAIARAEAAEVQLATLRQQITGLIAG